MSLGENGKGKIKEASSSGMIEREGTRVKIEYPYEYVRTFNGEIPDTIEITGGLDGGGEDETLYLKYQTPRLDGGLTAWYAIRPSDDSRLQNRGRKIIPFEQRDDKDG